MLADREHQLHRLAAAELGFSARALAHVHGDLDDAQAGVPKPEQRLDLGCAARIRDAEYRHRAAVRGVHPARRVEERAAECGVHRAAEDGRSESPARGGLVAVRLVALSGRKSRSDRDVRLARAYEGEESSELVDRMLPVRVDTSDELVSVLVCVGITRRDAFLKSPVLTEREHLGTVGGGDACRSVRRAVVDDEHRALGKAGVQLVEHRREVRLFVPGRDEDERVGRDHHSRLVVG